MRQRSLRSRLLLTFGAGAFALSSLFAAITYVGVRHVLVNNQQQNDIRQAYANAVLIRSTVYSSPGQLQTVLDQIAGSTDSQMIVLVNGQLLASSSGADLKSLTSGLTHYVASGRSASQAIYADGKLIFEVGTPVPSVGSQVYEVFSLNNLEATLRTLLMLLALGALFTTIIGLLGAIWFSRRAVRPLLEVSAAAAAIAEGTLTTRLEVHQTDREVQRLTESFNAMVSQLVERLERDARFASDVSHELRSPLTTMTTTARVLQLHRSELSPAGQESLDLLNADLSIFQSLVEDLLEMARSDAGAIPLLMETVEVTELVRQSVRSGARRHGLHAPPVNVAPGTGEAYVYVDRRRFERVITNLIDNAHRYAGDATAVRIEVVTNRVLVNVDDAGEGIPEDEREQVFHRFFRGRAAHDRGIARGTGLGLALVYDHVAAFGGEIRVLQSPEGGARFQIDLPVSTEDVQ